MHKSVQMITEKTGIPISAVYSIVVMVFCMAVWITKQEVATTANADSLNNYKTYTERRLNSIESKLDRIIDLLIRGDR